VRRGAPGRRQRFGLLDAVAAFAVLAALMSVAVSRGPGIAMLKALSVLLLFLYASAGVRLAVEGREAHFLKGLLMGCEVFVTAIAVLYLLLRLQPMGNLNSLGAVMAMVVQVLLWGTLVAPGPFTRRRQTLLYAICMFLTLCSHARAGMVAAAFSCGLLYVELRKYRLMMQGLGIVLIVVATGAIVRPEASSNLISTVTSGIVYKGKEQEGGLFASRQSPWQEGFDVIRNHKWFGTGFGTADNGKDAREQLGDFSFQRGFTIGFGSSYLADTTWVGLLGSCPSSCW